MAVPSPQKSGRSIGLGSSFPTPPTKPVQPAFELMYREALLGQSIAVRVDKAITPAAQAKIKRKVDAAVMLLNGAAGKLTADQLQVIHLLTGLTIAPGSGNARTGMDVYHGVLTLLDSYVLAPTVDTPFLASVFAHDSYHVFQHNHGKNDTPTEASQLEREADDFQIAVGKKIGLTPAQIKYLQDDKHTFFNTGRY